MKKIRTHHVLALAVFGTLVAGFGFTGSSIAARTSPPAGTNVWPSSAYVAPTPAGTKLGELNISHFEAIVHRGLNEGDLSVIDEYVSPTVVDHQYYGPGYPRGREGIKALTAALRTAFPDLHAVATTLLATNNGTQTFAIIRTTGTNTGKYLGIPPTGRHIVLNIMESALWKDGIMVEHWGVADNVGLLSQMGLLPLDKFPSFAVDKLGKTFQEQLANPPKIPHLTAVTPQQKLAATRILSEAVPEGNMWDDSKYVAPNYVDYEYYGQGYPTKPVDKHKMAIAVNKTAIPDLKSHIHELQVIGNQVFGILEPYGRNDGPYLGIPATGRLVDINVFEYWHFNSKGQVDVHNGVADLFGLVSQLGFIPPGSVPVYSPGKVDPKFLPELKKD